MAEENWADIGSTEDLSRAPLRHVTAGNRELAVSFKDGRFGAVSNACNHVGGPLGEGRLDGDYITCPWHNWKFHRCSGKGEPGFEEDAVPAYTVKVEGGRVLVDVASATKRTRKPHPPHPLCTQDRARARRRSCCRHLDLADGRGQPAVFRFRPPATACARFLRRPRRRKQDDPAERVAVSCLRRLLLEIRARLHVALLDHADGRGRPAGSRL